MKGGCSYGATKNSHLTLADRLKIEKGLNDCLPFRQIAKIISKDPSTISKVIRLNLIVSNKANFGRLINPCIHRDHCEMTQLCFQYYYKNKSRSCRLCKYSCYTVCPSFIEKPPYVCNGCDELAKYPLRKTFMMLLKLSRNMKKKRLLLVKILSSPSKKLIF